MQCVSPEFPVEQWSQRSFDLVVHSERTNRDTIQLHEHEEEWPIFERTEKKYGDITSIERRLRDHRWTILNVADEA